MKQKQYENYANTLAKIEETVSECIDDGISTSLITEMLKRSFSYKQMQSMRYLHKVGVDDEHKMQIITDTKKQKQLNIATMILLNDILKDITVIHTNNFDINKRLKRAFEMS